MCPVLFPFPEAVPLWQGMVSASPIPLVQLRFALEEQIKDASLDVSYVVSLSLLDVEVLYSISSSRVTRKQITKRREKPHSLME